MYILTDIYEIVENQDLFRNKDDFWKKIENKKIVLFNEKDIILSIFAKCLFWQIYNEILKNQDLYINKDDLWKKNWRKKILIFLKHFMFHKYICKMC